MSTMVPQLEHQSDQPERMEQALRESEARLSTVINSASMILWAVDRDGVFTFSQGRGLDLLGLRAGDVVGRSVFEVYADAPQVLEHVRRALAGDEFTALARVGEITFEARYSTLRDKNGDVSGVIGVATDVSERTRAEEDLRHRERQLADTQRLAALGSWDWDIPRNTIAWSDELYRIYGVEPGEYVPTYEGYLERVHPEDRERVRGALGTAYRTGNSFDFEERIVRPDGSVRVLHSMGTVTVDATGKPIRLVGACQDITDRKKAEEALRGAERRAHTLAKRMRALASAAAGVTAAATVEELETTLRDACRAVISFDSFAILFYDAQTHSFAYCATEDDGVGDPAGIMPATGTPAERVVRERRSLMTLNSGDPASQGARVIGTGRRSESVIRSPILRGETVLGVLSVQSYTPNLYTDQDVEVLEAVASLAATTISNIRLLSERRAAEAALQHAHDELERRVEERTAELAATNKALEAQIAERSRAEEALRRSEERFRSLIENGSDVITVLGTDGTIQYESPSIQRVLGHDPDALIGRSAFELVHPDDVESTAAVFGQVLQNPGQASRIEFRFLHADGSWRTLEAIGKTLLPDTAAEGVVVSSRDVTERKETETALQRSEEHFRRLIENAHDNIVIVDPTGIATYQSPSVKRMLGFEAEELVGRNAFDLVCPDDVAAVTAELGKVFANPGTIGHVEYRLRHKDGSWRYVEAYGQTVDPASAAEGVVANVRDITERREVEAALREREEYFRRLTESSNDLVQVLSPQGGIVYTGPSVERLLGYTPEEIQGRAAPDFIHPDDQPRVGEMLMEVLANPGISRSLEYRVLHKDGEWRWFEALGRTLSPDSAEEGVVANARDITDRKERDQALRESEESYRGLFDALTELVYVLDMEGRFVNVNEAALRAYGYSRDELIGQGPAFLADPQRVDIADTMARFREAAEGEPQQFEWWGRRKDSSVFPKEVVLTRSTYFGQDAVIAVARNITERKESENALQRAKETAEAANRAKSEFLSRMSHELRTPMNSILGFAQLLARKELPADQKKGVDHILKAGRHLLNLINEVLDITRIEANRQELSLEPVQVKGVLQEAMSLIRPLAAQRECRIEDQVTADPNFYVRADRQRLTQVLLNLLSNAIKYNRPGGSVRVSCTATDQDIQISVHDTGPGIPADKIEQLFVPFARLGAEQSGVEGTGLGLALSLRLAEAMDGRLDVESTPGVGSTFTVELPRAESPLARLARDGMLTLRSAEHGPLVAGTVLYIEDNLANLSLVESILATRPEITLVPALQGRLGLDLAWEHRPDLVLLDLHLPDIPGEEVLRFLKTDARTRHTPVVIISADATPGTVERLLHSGADGYLTKPLDVDEFLDRIDLALSTKSSP